MDTSMFLGASAIVSGLLCFSIYKLVVNLTKPSQSNLPPGPWTWPMIGNIPMIRRQPHFHNLLKGLRKQYGDVFRLQFGQLPIYFIFGHDNLHQVMMEQDKGLITTDRPDWMFIPQTIYKKQAGIMWANGEDYWKIHKLIVGCQSMASVQTNFETILREEFEDLFNNFTKSEEDPTQHLYSTCMNIAAMMTLGRRFMKGSEEHDKMAVRIDTLVKNASMHTRPESFLSWVIPLTKSQVVSVTKVADEFKDILRKEVEKRKDSANVTAPRDLIDMYFGQEEVSESVLVAAIIDLFIGGTDSFKNNIKSILFYLLKYPEVQTKCREEIKKVSNGRDWISYSERANYRYVNNVIGEVLRIGSAVPVTIPRSCNKDLTLGKYTIPKNSVMIIELHEPRIDPKLWENPDEFNPDRWNSCSTKGSNRFGYGPRTCPGATVSEIALFVLVTNMLLKYDMKSEDGNTFPLETQWAGVGTTVQPFKLLLEPIS